MPPALLSERPPSLFDDDADGGLTLEDVISGAWEELATGRPAACPVCQGRLAPRFGAGHGAVGGRCEDCGTELS